MGTSIDTPDVQIPQAVEQTQQYDDFMQRTRDTEDQSWQQRQAEVIQQEQEFQELAQEEIIQEEVEQVVEEQEIIDTEQQAQQEAQVIQDPTAPGQDADDFLYGFYGLIDDDEYYEDDSNNEDDFY